MKDYILFIIFLVFTIGLYFLVNIKLALFVAFSFLIIKLGLIGNNNGGC